MSLSSCPFWGWFFSSLFYAFSLSFSLVKEFTENFGHRIPEWFGWERTLKTILKTIVTHCHFLSKIWGLKICFILYFKQNCDCLGVLLTWHDGTLMLKSNGLADPTLSPTLGTSKGHHFTQKNIQFLRYHSHPALWDFFLSHSCLRRKLTLERRDKEEKNQLKIN